MWPQGSEYKYSHRKSYGVFEALLCTPVIVSGVLQLESFIIGLCTDNQTLAPRLLLALLLGLQEAASVLLLLVVGEACFRARA